MVDPAALVVDATAPVVSVVVPVGNGARHLPAFLAGIEAQVRPDMELVVVDDGSGDDTPHLLAAFAAATAWRCRVVSLATNHGAGGARRAGFAAAEGRYLLCLDVDDELAPGALDAVAGAVADQPDTVLVFDYAVRIGDRRTTEAGMVAPACDGPDAAVAALLRGEISPHLWNKVLPRHGLVPADFSERRIGEDLATLVRVLQVHPRVRRVPVRVVDYVVGDASLSQTGDLVAYTSVTGGQLADVRALLADPVVWAACAPAFERWFAPRVLANAALAAARRPDGRFAEVRANIVAQTTLGQALAGLRAGDRGSSALLVLVRVAPPVFRLMARSSARRSARLPRQP